MANFTSTQNKWDAIYSDKAVADQPCWVLRNNLHLLPTAGRSLDLACGLSANALCLAQRGLDAHAWDASTLALDKLNAAATHTAVSITTQLRDVELQPPTENSFDVITVSHFLYRPIMADLVAALRPGGLLFYQTFNTAKADGEGPSSAKYLLTENELLTTFSALQLLFYREDGNTGDTSSGLRNCSYFVGKKPLNQS